MITVHLPRDLAEEFDAAEVLSIAGRDLSEVIAGLNTRYPGMASWLSEADGNIRQHLSVFVDGQRLKNRDSATAELSEAQEIWVLRAISGG